MLSGEKQRIGRSYNFPNVVEWFAERADRILLLFDAHKLDISDEFKLAIEALRGHDDKIRVILNKADVRRKWIETRRSSASGTMTAGIYVTFTAVHTIFSSAFVSCTLCVFLFSFLD